MGPYESGEAFEVLNTKLSANLISSDSFVTDGKNYGKKVWTAGSFAMSDLEKLSRDDNAIYHQNYDFDLNENLLNTSESENLLFSDKRHKTYEKFSFISKHLKSHNKIPLQKENFANAG